MPRNPRQLALERLSVVSVNRQQAELALTSLRTQEHPEIAKARAAGLTQVEIARVCRLTPQRIAQIMRRTVPDAPTNTGKRATKG